MTEESELAVDDRSWGRARLTRQALVRAAADQFYSGGYQGASLDGIVTGAGVTKGALYFHFAHKRALANAVIAEMNALRAVMVDEITERGLDPLRTLLAESDQVVQDLINHPIVRGGNRLLRDPMLRSAGGTQLAAQRYRRSEGAVATQLDAASAAGLLRPEVGSGQRAALARSIIATIIGHQMICDLTGADTELWGRITEMWQHLLPRIATDGWLSRWHAGDWAHRPRPGVSSPWAGEPLRSGAGSRAIPA
ncbi:MAG TPA: TetR/AcrR family transcriptional regulator [Pseudonocardia sp.]|jgi:AcrR family transcriptional regulator